MNELSSPDFNTIILEFLPIKGTNSFVAKLTLNRPRRGNSITPQMTKEIMHACDIVSKNKSRIRLFVLTGGDARFFCTGMDMKQANSGIEGDSVNHFLGFFKAIGSLAVPTMAILNGPAMGGGVGLLFCCDIRISTSKSHYLALTEVKRGLLPALISPYIVNELGKGMATELMLGGKIGVPRLYATGHISSIIGDSSYPSLTYAKEPIIFASSNEAIEFYGAMAANAAPNAFEKIKTLVHELKSHTDDEFQRKYVSERFKEMMKSEEAMYGMSCFLNKTKPDWSSMEHKSKL